MSKKATEKAEALKERFNLSYEQILSLRFAINVAIASTIVWNSLVFLGDAHPVWAIASMVAASEPQVSESKRLFRSRMINVLVGCGVGLFFILVTGTKAWALPLALASTVLISGFLVQVKTMWRQAPITAAVVIGAGVTFGSANMGVVEGLHKVLEVIYGCLVGLIVSWVMSNVWLIKIPEEE